MLINNEEDAIKLFCTAATKHAVATETGEYSIGNKAYTEISAALKWLEVNHATHLLHSLLPSPSIGVRLWVASYLLLQYEPAAQKVLEEIASLGTIHGFTAEMTLQEWRKGKLQPFW